MGKWFFLIGGFLNKRLIKHKTRSVKTMIKVVELTCTEDLHLNRRGTFTAGKTYYSKISKSGQNIIALSNEGKWQPVRSF